MRIPLVNRHQLRRAGSIGSLVVLFTVTSLQVASAADGSGGGMLAPFDVTSSEGVPLDHYELVANPGGATDFMQEAQTYLMSGLFALTRVVVGLECWVIKWAYSFPLVKAVSDQAQKLSDAYHYYVVDALGLPGLLLAWAFVVCGIMLLRGRPGRALGELGLTLMIAAVAASALIRPDVILGDGGLLDQTHQASIEVGAITANRGVYPTGKVTAETASTPINNTLTDTFVAQPFQLLEFGRLIPVGDPAYPIYTQAITNGPFNTDAHRDQPDGKCIPLPGPGGDAYCNAGKAAPVDCSQFFGIGKTMCQDGNSKPPGNVRSYADLASGFSKVDPAITAYVVQPSWDRVIGALLLLVAACIVGALVLAMVLALFAAQTADAVLASCGYPVLIWATLPGPSRGVLWRWIGSFVSSALVMFVAAVFIPLFGVAVSVFLQGAGQGLVPRLVLVDLLALAALGFHRRLLAGASSAGSRLADRLRWARIGGSGSGDEATRTGQIISGALASNGAYGGAGGAGLGRVGLPGMGADSAAHRYLTRRSQLMSAAHALADPTGTPLHPGRFLADIGKEARRGLAPFTVATRGAQVAWSGKPLSPEELERRQKRPGPGGELPIGSRLHNRLVQTRGGRAVLGTTRTAWAASFGAPATWTRARRHGVRLMDGAEHQLEHYTREYQNYRDTEWKPGYRAMTTPAREVLTTGQRLGTAASLFGDDHGEAVRRAAANVPAPPAPAAPTAATAATIRMPAPGPVAPPAASRTDPGPVAGETFVQAIHRARREAEERTRREGMGGGDRT